MVSKTRRSIPVLVSLVAVVVVAAPAGGAAKLTLRSVHSASLGRNVAATPGGRTLYHRTRETTHHFLCTGSCATIWPPLTVGSKTVLAKGAGVHGTLGKVRRADGRLQVTLNGQPLYRFSGDHRTGDAKGEGIPGEGMGGGTWHAIHASAPRTTSPPATSPPPSTTYPTYAY